MLSRVVSSFASVTILKVLSRVLEFLLRVYLIREVLSPEILAEMVALDLLLTTSLHIAKSCFKPSYQQVESKDEQRTIVSSMNLMSVGVVATALSAAAVVLWQWNQKIEVKYVNESIIVYALCSVL
jgi:O-antigen/teichoic acid export membrane protein